MKTLPKVTRIQVQEINNRSGLRSQIKILSIPLDLKTAFEKCHILLILESLQVGERSLA